MYTYYIIEFEGETVYENETFYNVFTDLCKGFINHFEDLEKEEIEENDFSQVEYYKEYCDFLQDQLSKVLNINKHDFNNQVKIFKNTTDYLRNNWDHHMAYISLNIEID